MYSYLHKFIFVHIPRTSGNAIQSTLSGYCDETITRLSGRKIVGKEPEGFKTANSLSRFEVKGEFTKTKHAWSFQYYNAHYDSGIDDLYIFS